LLADPPPSNETLDVFYIKVFFFDFLHSFSFSEKLLIVRKTERDTIIKVKQSRYRPGLTQRLPES